MDKYLLVLSLTHQRSLGSVKLSRSAGREMRPAAHPNDEFSRQQDMPGVVFDTLNEVEQ